jgi:hypothetical protein
LRGQGGRKRLGITIHLSDAQWDRQRMVLGSCSKSRRKKSSATSFSRISQGEKMMKSAESDVFTNQKSGIRERQGAANGNLEIIGPPVAVMDAVQLPCRSKKPSSLAGFLRRREPKKSGNEANFICGRRPRRDQALPAVAATGGL